MHSCGQRTWTFGLWWLSLSWPLLVSWFQVVPKLCGANWFCERHPCCIKDGGADKLERWGLTVFWLKVKLDIAAERFPPIFCGWGGTGWLFALLWLAMTWLTKPSSSWNRAPQEGIGHFRLGWLCLLEMWEAKSMSDEKNFWQLLHCLGEIDCGLCWSTYESTLGLVVLVSLQLD